MAARRRSVTVADPQVLKALAHPVRQELMTLLVSGEVFTATQVAGRVRMTPSAVSHHLRQLERYGLARRANGSRDGRERLWESAVGDLTISATARHEVGVLAIEAIVTREIELLTERLRRQRSNAQPGRHIVGLSRLDVWVTPDEAAQLDRDLERLLKPFARRTGHHHPKDTEYRVFVYSLLPDEPPLPPATGQRSR
jgi:DNA-binding transcriptional ArsR family regulator